MCLPVLKRYKKKKKKRTYKNHIIPHKTVINEKHIKTSVNSPIFPTILLIKDKQYNKHGNS